MDNLVSRMLGEGILEATRTRQYAGFKLAIMNLQSQHAISHFKSHHLASYEAIDWSQYAQLHNPFLARNAYALAASDPACQALPLLIANFAETVDHAIIATEHASLGFAGLSLTTSISPFSSLPQRRSFKYLRTTSGAYLTGYDSDNFCPSSDQGELPFAIDRALAICERAPDIYCDIVRDVQCFVPITTPARNVHRSHTVPQLPGVVFLSHAADDLRLAEAIVHEHAHIQLDLFLTHDRTVIADGALFYSPWRSDPRPAYGLLHAVYVFIQVCDFYKALLHHDDILGGYDRSWIVDRIVINYARIRLGFAQLAILPTTEIGRSLFMYIEAFIGELPRHIEIPLHCPPQITEHYRSWCEANCMSEHNVTMAAAWNALRTQHILLNPSCT